jgi:type I restriction enzyme S subunit
MAILNHEDTKTRSKYKPYPSYKDSGIEWLGEVPVNWSTKRLKNIIRASITDGPHTTPVFIDSGVPFLSVDGIQNGELVFDKCRYISQEDHKEYKKKADIENGDILLGKAASIGKVARVKVDFEFSIWSPLALIKPNLNKVLAPYLEYLLKSPLTQYQIQQLSTSNTQQNISMADIPKFVFSVPAIDEQKAIANFLDQETGKMDLLIEKQQAMIALLKEKRQAVISHAVTKGLNPDAPMKDSGIEWLGQIPEHWKVSKFKFLGEAVIGLTYNPNDIVNEGEGKTVLRSTNIQNNKISLHDNVYVDKVISHKLTTKVGDILICSRNGSRALIGKNAKIDEQSSGMTFGAFTTIFRTSQHEYLYWVLNSSLFDYQSGSFMTTTINQLTTGTLNSFETPLPSASEQTEIASYLDNQTQKIDTLIEKSQQTIALLKEGKTALISSAVTGKIDVRGIV